MKKIILCLLALALCALSACGIQTNIPSDGLPSESAAVNESLTPKSEGELRVHFIDVGQGDSAFIELPDGKCILIDAGERESAGAVISLIDCLGYTKIDHVIATHPHADHIGGMQTVIENFDIGEVYMPNAVTDTKTFINLLEAMDEKGLSITEIKAGLNVDFGSGVNGSFVAPSVIVDDLNNCSAILRLAFGSRAFLFTGDAELQEEETVTADISCDVLKVGHHGSSTSSGNAFLAKAKPSIAVISCGKDNSYGHPHSEALGRLSSAGVENIYRTDISGTVSVTIDGEELSVSVGLAPDGYKWVLNISSKKVHTASCDSAVEMKEANKAYSKRALATLQSLGYTLCGSCDPAE